MDPLAAGTAALIIFAVLDDFASAMSDLSGAINAPERTAKLSVRVARTTHEAEGIRSFEFVRPDGDILPPFTAGAHLKVYLDGGMIRQYSLCSDPADRRRYEIAVLREESGRGGSVIMHSRMGEGDTFTISTPVNHFPLAGRGATGHLLIAGGIGVTPMMAMIAELEAKGAPWTLHYLTRSPERTAFRDRLAPHVATGKVFIHHDNGDPASGPGLPKLLSDFAIGTHLYYCGPPGFMTACGQCVEAWPPHAVHREYFTAAEGRPDASQNTAFEVRLKSRGKVLAVPADRSIVDVLREAGCEVETDCREGYCGTCITRYLAGEPEHRDTVLSEKERKSYLMVCCARAKSASLELDL